MTASFARAEHRICRVDLPRAGVDPEELRRCAEYTELRAEVGRAVKAAAA
jgi:taurine transport system ATP-binding protein